MTAKRTLLLVLTTSATTGALVWALAGARVITPATPQATISDEDFQALKAQVTALERAGGRALAQQIVAAPPPEAKPAEAEGAPLLVGPKTPPSPEQERARAAQTFARYDDHFHSQRRDDAWATQTEHSVEAVLRDPAFAFARIDEFRCASSVCRLQAQVANEEEFETFANAFGPKTTFLPSGTFRQVDDGHGGLKVEAFLVKAGHSLPPS
jgi:hypothetical protein